MDGRGNPSKEEPEQEGLGSPRPVPVVALGTCPEGPVVWLGSTDTGSRALRSRDTAGLNGRQGAGVRRWKAVGFLEINRTRQ